ncbi:hypothetical protein DP939_42260 [Spongiactinospora rosea]|uniref:Uncharacterized protein n=2 Tax=Spongiactinospora rosea TaxID=2248750 RepID=A0A366LJW1_9ACTN|nr:hypothetical protein DP939_42260 [Spongiactinospora rosea]
MLAYPMRRPPRAATPEQEETARRLVAALRTRDIPADIGYEHGKVQVALGPDLIVVVQDDGIWWHSPRLLRPGIPLYVHRGTVAGAAEALACDYALLNPTSEAIAEVQHDACV